jgi:inner membrane protein
MDSLTQIVLGGAVGEVVLGKKIGNKAILFGAIAGTIPDLDVLQGLIQQTISHRGFTHSFFFAFLMSPILAWLTLKVVKKADATFKEWTLLYFLGFVTHILLDVQTIYGTELLWPYRARLTTSNVFVADPIYTLPFLLILIAVMFYKKDSITRRNLNRFGLILSTSYLMLTMVFKAYTYQKFIENLKEQNIDYLRIETGPTPLNSILWFANVETKTQYLTGNYSLFDKDDKIQFRTFDKNFVLRNQLKNYENFKRLNHFSKNWYLLTPLENDTIRYQNLRFGGPISNDEEPNFVFSYKLKVVGDELRFKEDFGREKMKGNMRSIFAKLWNRIKGNK